jgi:hypothetical protein
MTFGTLSASRGLAPSGPNGSYRRRDYLRGASIALSISLGFAAALAGLAAIFGDGSIIMAAVAFMVGIGILAALSAMLILLVYAALGVARPPGFADPVPPVREDEPDDDDA